MAKVTKVSAAWEQVFGGVNNSFSRNGMKRPLREGKTARDKANGTQRFGKNIRVYEETRGKNGARDGMWVKVGGR